MASLLYLSLIAMSVALTNAYVWHVHGDGSDIEGCGEAASPCASLSHVFMLSNAMDTILLTGSSNNVYDLCSTGHPYLLQKSLKIIGFGTHASIGCKQHQPGNRILKFQPRDTEKSLHMENVVVQNGRLILEGKVTLQNVTLTSAGIWSTDNCRAISLQISHSHFKRSLDWRGKESAMGLTRSPVGSYVVCQWINSSLDHSTFNDVIFEVMATRWGEIQATNSVFAKEIVTETGIGGLNVTLPFRHGNLVVKHCIFEKNVHYEPIYSAVNIESAALRVEATRNPNDKEASNVTVYVSDSIFRFNERAVSMSRAYKSVIIERCLFNNNHVMHAAAAIRLAITAYKVKILHCDFHSNSAGFNPHAPIPGKFQFDGEQVHLNNERINGVLALVGKGGAIRIHKARVQIEHCLFLNNTARLLGGSVFVDRAAHVSIVESHFENSDSGILAMQGDIIYSSGNLTLSNTTFDVQSANNHVSILRHAGIHWSIDVTHIIFTCPVGHRLSMVNTTSHRIIDNMGIGRSHKLDQLYYYCQTCGNNQYSLDKGSIYYAVTGEEEHYMTLMINGEKPFQTHPVLFIYSNITCRDCPYGAHCDSDIRSVPNFWGYEHNSKVTFQHCPSGYCCSSTQCPSFNSCAKGREGTLCGQCRQGHSEALFSASCLPNDDCSSFTWIVPTTLLMASVYVLFLLYQRDIREFIPRWTLNWNFDFCNKGIRRNGDAKRSHHSNNGTSDEMSLTGNRTQKSNSIEKNKIAEGGCLIILFYYFQDALLLNIDSVYSKNMSEFERRLKAFLVGLFRFRLDFYQFLDDVCLYPDLQPVSKLFLKSLFVPYVIVMFGFLSCISGLSKRLAHRSNGDQTSSTSSNILCSTSFSSRLAAGFILAMLFTYQKLATATFTLLNCVPVENRSVLFIDGTKDCFQPWQYGILAYALVCIIPFSVVLMIGPPLLRQKRISLSLFFFGCLFPLPSLFLWAIIAVKKKPSVREVIFKEETRRVLEQLQGPFKDAKSESVFGQLCWSGVLLARRLILFICYTFINDVLVRLLCMMSTCFVILMHHTYVQPYKSSRSNTAGALSAAALLVVGCINLLKASFEAAEYIPKGPYKLLMQICVEIENTLVLWLPLISVCAGLLLITLKVILSLIEVLYRKLSCEERQTVRSLSVSA